VAVLQAHMRLFALLLIAVCLLAGCNNASALDQRYVDKRYFFSFIPPNNWTVTSQQTSACLTSVEARNGDCRLYICVSQRPEEFLPTSSDFANCELVKTYVAEKLKGYNVMCRPSLIQGRRTYDAIYLRNVADESGKVRLQLVRQTFLSRGVLLYTLTSYVFGENEEALKAAISPCNDEILHSESTFFLHQPPAK
jgi:hypothetical protein